MRTAEGGWTHSDMKKVLYSMAKNSDELGGRQIARLSAPPTPLEFLRLVKASSPALIQGTSISASDIQTIHHSLFLTIYKDV